MQEHLRMQQYAYGNTVNISPPSSSKVSTRISRKRLIQQVDQMKTITSSQEDKENIMNQALDAAQVLIARRPIQKDSERLLRSPTDKLLSPVSRALQRRRNRRPLTEVKVRRFDLLL